MNAIDEASKLIKSRLAEIDQEKSMLESALTHMSPPNGEVKKNVKGSVKKGAKTKTRKRPSFDEKQLMLLDRLKNESLTCPELSKVTGLSKSTVSRTLERMAATTPPTVIKVGLKQVAGSKPSTIWQSVIPAAEIKGEAETVSSAKPATTTTI